MFLAIRNFHVTFKLAYLTPPTGFGESFPVNVNYPRCLENSNMIIFGLTSDGYFFFTISSIKLY